MRFIIAACIAACVEVLAACGSGAGPPTPTPIMLPSPTAMNTPTPTPAVTPTFTPQRVTFPKGATSVTLPAQINTTTAAAYVLYVLQGQTMTVRVKPAVNIVILGTHSQALTSASGALQYKIPQSGDYTVVVMGEGNVSVEISIPPA